MASNFISSLDNKDGHQTLNQKHSITNNNMHRDDGDQKAVKSTADTAILHKLSCVEKGYYDDPYIHGMSLGASGLNKNNNSSNSRSAAVNSTEPIIRKGTHARVKAVERAIDAFLSLTLSSNIKGSGDKVSLKRQIVILGAGRDTTYLRYRFQQTNDDDIIDNVNWYEVDHESIIVQKAHTWLPNCIPKDYDCKCYSNGDNHDDIDRVVSYTVNITPKDTTCEDDKQQQRNSSSNYHLIGHDLRSSPSKLFDILTSPKHGYDKSIPTLFILECVVMYLPDDASRDLLQYIANSPKETEGTSSDEETPFVAVVIYDPIPSNDRFGQLMIDNLQKVGITGRGGRTKSGQQQHQRSNSNNIDEEDSTSPQLSLETTQTLSDQLTKLTQCGFDIATGCDMMAAYDYGVISLDDRRRASRCEMLDELEEFVLLMKHYCLLVGVSSSPNGNDRSNDCIGYQLCSVCEDSLIGFREGRSMVARKNSIKN